MFKSYMEVLDYFHTKENKLGMNFGLGRMENILNKLHNPEKKLKCIHIAGSNGKGSTLNYLKEILTEQGIKTGTFTSPHIEKLNERIMINDKQISDDEILSLMNKLAPILREVEEEDFVTFFEVLTILAILYFVEQDAEIVIFETGLGGRLDSTNVIHPILSIITSISLEHTNILGNTLEEIAYEKAGIIKPGAPVIAGRIEKSPLEVIRNKAIECGSPIFSLSHHFEIGNFVITEEGQAFSFKMENVEFDSLEISMMGLHQLDNAALAVAACVLLNESGVHISEEAIRKGLRVAKWKGRIEVLSKDPLVIIDGAHNPDGMEVLVDTLIRVYPERKLHFVMSVLEDKNYREMVRLAETHAERMMFTEFNMKRVLPAEKLFECSSHKNKYLEKDWQTAIETTLQGISKNDAVIITGSLYFLAETRGYLVRKLL